MSGRGTLRQSIGALDGNLEHDVRLDGSAGLHGCEVGDETVQVHPGQVPCLQQLGRCLPGGGAVKEGALSKAGSVVTRYAPGVPDPR